MAKWIVNVLTKSAVPAETDSEGNETVFIVSAETAAEALREASRQYARLCTKRKRARMHAAGLCSCGRKSDVPKPQGGFRKKCSVCVTRDREQWRPKARENQRRQLEGLPKIPRDESARVVVMQERQRDRRSELRIETLLEVQRQWQSARTNGHFTRWLDEQIKECTNASTSKAASQ